MPGSSPTPFPPEGERYGRFVLLERIGRGGMAEVFRAVAQGVEGFARVFVVKRIQREQSDNPQLVEMFANEARISALLNHPNIVQVFDFGQLDGSYFISMEYLRGKDLLAVLRQLRAASRFMSPALVAMIAREVATGLAYAHTLIAPGGKSLDIIHRDVSPSNIMLLRAGGVKLLDFGIAKASAALRDGGRGHTTGTGMVKGKLSYLSPEQVRHEPVDGRSDIFSLGVVMWECLTGKRLFHDRSDYHTMNNVLTRVIPAPSTQQPDVPAALDAIVLRALDRDRGRRTQSAKLLADELDHFLVQNPLPPRSQPQLLDELFGDDGHELESMPAVGSGPLPFDAETPVLTAVMLPTIPSITAITAVPSTPSRSDGLLPTSSVSGERSTATQASSRLWPWVAGGVLVIAAFAAGRLARPRGDGAEGPASPPGMTARPALPVPSAPIKLEQPPAPPAPVAPAAAPVAVVAPAAEAAETDGRVSVRVESDPPGADVTGPNWVSLGHTPFTTSLPRSDSALTLTFRKPGYAPSQHAITPDRDVAALVNLRTGGRAGRVAPTSQPEPKPGGQAPPAEAAADPAPPAAAAGEEKSAAPSLEPPPVSNAAPAGSAEPASATPAPESAAREGSDPAGVRAP